MQKVFIDLLIDLLTEMILVPRPPQEAIEGLERKMV